MAFLVGPFATTGFRAVSGICSVRGTVSSVRMEKRLNVSLLAFSMTMAAVVRPFRMSRMKVPGVIASSGGWSWGAGGMIPPAAAWSRVVLNSVNSIVMVLVVYLLLCQ